MAADWDLYAVVRSCSSVLKGDNSAVGSSRPPKGNDGSWDDDPFARLASVTLEEENDPFPFPNLSKSGCKNTDLTAMDPSFSRFDVRGPSGQHHQQQEQPTITASTAAPIFTFGEFGNQRQLPQPLLLKKEQVVPRTRKRKNQNKTRTVCRVTGDNLLTDQWSWRKYGQKPIKGSSNPRHYYKCSSSKGCLARKHVERSELDPDTFIVTYTGDHVHSKPSYRNSLGGSSRRKRLLAMQKTAIANANANAAFSSFTYPTGPLPAPEDGATSAANQYNAGDNGVEEGETADKMALETSPDAENDDVIMIPNMHVNEDLFQALGPNWPAFGGNFPSWGSGSSASGRG